VAYVDKGKPVERQGRKAMGLSEEKTSYGRQAAETYAEGILSLA